MNARSVSPREIDDENTPEPLPGLPEALPEGETILWRGSPTFAGIAIHAFRIRAVAVYFVIVAGWRAAAMAGAGAPSAEIGSTVSAILMLGVAALAVLALLAWLMQRETVYTITSKRVVMRFGVALRKTVNIPFRIIASASLKAHGKGRGDVALSLKGPDRIAYILMWPHVRPLRFSPAEPTLRAIPDAARVARILAEAVKAAAPEEIAIARPAAAAPKTRKTAIGQAAAA